MTVDLRHARVSGLPVSGDPSLMQGPDWDAAHVLKNGPASLLGRADAAAGQAATQEIALEALTMGFVAGQLKCLITWGNLAGKPATFPATLPINESDVTNLVSDLGLKAPILSPAFGGVPTTPTPSGAHTNDNTIPTTAWVQSTLAGAIAGGGPPTGGASGDLAGTYPGPTIKASVNLTGSPTTSTQAAADSSTKIATTAFVAAALLAGGFLTTAAAASTYAPINAPLFTGNARGVTPATADNSVSLATTAFVKAQGFAVAANYLPLAGGTLSGPLSVDGSAAASITPLYIQTNANATTYGAFYNASTGANATAGIAMSLTGIANAYALFTVNNNAGNPDLTISLGAGITGGFYLPALTFGVTPAAATEDVHFATTAFVKKSGATASFAQVAPGGDIAMAASTIYTPMTLPSVGAAGQVWLVMLTAGFYCTSVISPYIGSTIYANAAVVTSGTIIVTNGSNTIVGLQSVWALTGPTVFSFQTGAGAGVTTCHWNGDGSRLVAIRLA